MAHYTHYGALSFPSSCNANKTLVLSIPECDFGFIFHRQCISLRGWEASILPVASSVVGSTSGSGSDFPVEGGLLAMFEHLGMVHVLYNVHVSTRYPICLISMACEICFVLFTSKCPTLIRIKHDHTLELSLIIQIHVSEEVLPIGYYNLSSDMIILWNHLKTK